MRLVHLADLHLGFRQYYRLTPAGINQREADVAATFRRVVERVIALRPDVVVVGGDIFHNVRPTNPAILLAFQQFGELTRALPDAEVVIVAGNHDLPRTSDAGCILKLFSGLGIHVVDKEPRRLTFPERDLAILAVPDAPGTRPKLDPDPAARYNVLLLHGEVEGMLPDHVPPGDRASVEITAEELGPARWTYVALGHYHVYREIAPNAFYSGSIDYTSFNAWGELLEERTAGLPGKGFVERDLATGEHRFHHVEPARRLVDLPAVSARGRAVNDLDAAIRAVIDGCDGGIDEKIVRLVVRDGPRHGARDIDQTALREYRRRALHFHLDTRRPEILRMHGHGAPGRRPSLKDIVRDKLRGRVVDADVPREALVALGLKYLDEVERGEASQQGAAASAEEG
ncbi:MAG TPA: metallophosphoesterase [Gemmatimonadaceae bacterium]|nr:metallophosphoesterase [Gemmatimonadaceae bacterium]